MTYTRPGWRLESGVDRDRRSSTRPPATLACFRAAGAIVLAAVDSLSYTPATTAEQELTRDSLHR